MSSYRSLLLELSNSLTTSDLQELKFLCGDAIPPGRAEKITRGFELFGALEQLNMLSEENRDFLASKLIAINRNDLRNKLLGIQGDQNVLPPVQGTIPVMEYTSLDNRPVSDTLLHDLVEELSTSWKMLGRRLVIPEGAISNIDTEHRRVVEKGMAMFAEWKRRKGDNATVRVLREALEKTGRRDLSEKVRDFVLSEQQALVNTAIRTDPPVEERQQFLNLNDVGRTLPYVQPPGIYAPGIAPYIRRTIGLPQPQGQSGIHVPAAVSGREPQEQAESHVPTPVASHNNYPSTSSTRIPQPQGSSTDTSRQPIPVQGNGAGVDRTDAPHSRTSVQVDPLLRQQLRSDGCFLNPEKYDPVKFLGSGGYAKVYLVVQKDTGKKMACKMCDLGTNDIDTQKLVKSIKTEFMALSALKHRHIVEFFYFEEIHKTALFFLEYMEGGTIEDLLRQRGEPLQEHWVQKFTKQLLIAVEYLHNNGIKQVIHKDIKGGNILLDRLQTNLKLADFGICTIMEELKTATGGLVTENNIASFHWTSPELLAVEEFGRNTDIWSVGCTVIEMLTTKPPLFFDKLTMRQKMYKITHHEVEPPTGCSSVAFGFLKRCLCPKEERASAAQLLTDPFVSDM